jgi:hypothetical protein
MIIYFEYQIKINFMIFFLNTNFKLFAKKLLNYFIINFNFT